MRFLRWDKRRFAPPRGTNIRGEKTLSSAFFTLSDHAARQSGTRGEIREGVFSDGINEGLRRFDANLWSEKYRIDDIFHSHYFMIQSFTERYQYPQKISKDESGRVNSRYISFP